MLTQAGLVGQKARTILPSWLTKKTSTTGAHVTLSDSPVSPRIISKFFESQPVLQNPPRTTHLKAISYRRP